MRESQLQREIKQNKPFSSTSAEASLALLRTADVVRTRISTALGRFDMTSQQYNVLRILRGAGENGLPTLEIAERMIEHAPGITRLIDRLQTRRLVRRERSIADRRQVFCFITDEGLARLAELDEPVREVDRTAIGHLSEIEMEQLIALLDAVRRECDRSSDENR